MPDNNKSICSTFEEQSLNENCKHKPMQCFMETCLLILLTEQDSHGYRLTEQLKKFGFADINVSTLYRITRKMDDRCWVTSSWEKGDKGPQRRMYSITQQGLSALDEWIGVFLQRRADIDLLLSKYQQISNKTEE